VVLDEFLEWLQRSSLDRRIKDTNTKLKRIANQKKENRLLVFQGNQKEKKKNNSGEDDLTYGPRNCDISEFSSIKLHHLLLLCENSTPNILLQQPWWTGYQGRNFGYGLLVSRLSRGNYGFVYGTSGNIRSSLEVYAIANAR
jgi:hypothetical protein